ncbi:mediator of RNA polymerase II transcription subunit 22 [Monosporozyma unispora]|nr:mediator complex subunit [Kazachstania unispora]
MSHQALFERLDQSLELLSVKLAELIKLAAVEDSERQDLDDNNNSDESKIESQLSSDLMVATAGVSMVSSHTPQLIKGVQDLLSLTRTIRETWLLNQIPNNSRDESQEEAVAREIDYDHLQQLLDTAIDTIVGIN